MEAMPKTIKRTLSGSEMTPPFHRTRHISLNYCAAYFFRKDGVCVALAYFFPGRVRRLFLPGTLQVRSKHVNDTVRKLFFDPYCMSSNDLNIPCFSNSI